MKFCTWMRICRFVFLFEPVHKILKRVIGLFGLDLKVRVISGRFSNVGEILKSDALGKVYNVQGKISKFTLDSEWNCRDCRYGEECGIKNIIYRIEEKKTGRFYIGSTGNTLKSRTQDHIYNLTSVMNERVSASTTSFSSFFSRKFKLEMEKNPGNYKAKDFWGRFSYKVVRKVVLANAGTPGCTLCSEERYHLVKNKMLKNKIINQNEELYFKCRHTCRWEIWVWAL